MEKLYKSFEDHIWGSVVHIGCGDGEWLYFLKQMDKFELYGITRDKDNVVMLRKENIRAEVMLLDNILVFVDRCFDTLCCFDILDDFTNCQYILRCMYCLMDKGSRLLIKTKSQKVINQLNELFELVEKIDDTKFVFRRIYV